MLFLLMLSAMWFLHPAAALAALKYNLQGQNGGSTNWSGGPILNHFELDYVPIRAVFTTGPATNQAVTVTFDHTQGTAPGIQFLTGFTNSSSNVFITSPPVLSAPAGVSIWSYSFTVTVTDGNAGYLYLFARLSAGSHAFPGAALSMKINGAGQLQIKQPAVVLGSPDMALVKTGPSQANTNQIITYVISWTNKLISAQTALGVQVIDLLPPEVTYVPNSGSKGIQVLGNTVTWDLGNLAPGRRGILTYKVMVTNNIPATTTFANFAQIICSQDDANPADNSSSVSTTVVVPIPPTANDDFYSIGKNMTLNVPPIGVLLNDSNVTSAVLLLPPVNGTVTFNTNGSFVYVPATNYVGQDVFAYRALNGTNLSGPAVVTIDVTNTCFLVGASNYTTNNATGQCGTIVNYPPPTTTGDCAPITCTPPSGLFFPVGSTNVTCTNTDGINASFLVTVIDTEPPAMTCSSNLIFSANSGQCSRSNVTFAVSATDNCGSVTNITSVPPSGSTFPVGVTIVTNTATDSAGNSSQCTFTVTVNDTQVPTVTCPADVTVNADADACFATSVALGSPTASDNCGTVTVTNNAPAQFPVGTNLVTWTVTDNSGNTNTCQQRVIVRDTQPPTLTTCPSDLTVNANTNSCFATGVVLGSPTANDNCGSVSITNNAPALFPVGTNLVTWTVTDSSGNSTNCLQLVIVRDVQPPTITCPADVSAIAAAGLCFSTNVALGSPITGDNCGAVSVTNDAPAQFPVGTNVVTWTATDGSGNVTTCQQHVVVRDTEAPTINCPTSLVLEADLGQCSRSNVTFVVTANDNCSGVTVVSIPPSGSTFPLGTTTVTNIATDASGNQTTCTFTVNTFAVTVTDTEPPVIACPTNVVLNADPSQCGRSNVTFIVTATDNCTVTNLVSIPPSGGTFPVGVTTVTNIATDIGGNQAACTFTVTILDTELPVITCPALVNVTADNGTCASTNVNLGSPVASDNCNSGVTVTNDAPASFPVGTNLVTWTITDASGNTATCVQTVLVTDNQPPVITTCPPLVNVNVNNGACGATNVTLGTPEATDNCGGIVTFSNNAPATFPVATNLVTWTATDASGNTATCVQTVVVTDNQPPVITTCPADVTVNADTNACFATGVALGSPVASDNCGAVSFTNNAPAQFPAGTNVVIWTVTDGSGNTANCQQRVIVRDTQAPTINCPSSLVLEADPGQCSRSNVTFVVTATDNCSGVSVVSIPPSGSTFAIGTTTVTNIATDASGNQTMCTFTVNTFSVTINDTEPPVITCPSNLVAAADPGQCSRSNVTFLVTATDNCSVTNLVSTPPSGSTFPVGVTTVTNIATDAGGNQAVCTFTVTIQDSLPPVISTCPALVNAVVNNGSCGATNVNLGLPEASDNCGGVVTFSNNAPAAFALGTNLVTWTARDAGGNASTCVQTVVVTDTVPPTITTCPALVNVNVNNGACGATNVTLGTPVATDNCGGAVTFSNNAPAIFPVGTNFLTWTGSDVNGNTSTCIQTVVVIDNQPPVITTCPGLVSVNVNDGACGATNVTLGTPVATDNCGGTVTFSNNAPTSFPLGTNLVTWTATDASGNAATCVQTVIVTDNQPPVITTCPAPVTVVANAGTCAATNVNLGSPVTSDNCGGAVSVTNNAPASFPVGTNLVTWRATDASGNTATCVQTVIVTDNQPPVITTCPAAVNVAANAGTCAATNVNLGNPPVTTDNCGGVITATNNAPASFPVGTNLVTWTARDGSGNTATCVQTVIVTDNQPPVITTCPALVTVVANNGTCAATNVNLGNPPVTTDNCGGVITVTNNAPVSFPVGTNLVTWTVTDASGNTATCVQTVIVTDNQPPVITTCPAPVSVVANAGTCAATNVSLGTPEATDNCGGVVTVTNNAPASFPVGTNLVTWTATDASGNTANCVQTVIVTDNQPPVITACPADVTVNTDTNACSATGVALGSPITSDNCGGVTVTNNAPVQFPVGTNVVTWTVRDGSGNTANCQQRVIVRDTEAPVINCPSSLVLEADPGQCTKSNVTFVVTASDNCSGVTVVSIPPSGSTFRIGTTVVTNIATDASGNQTTCTFTVNTFSVTVSDTEPPVITCPTNLVLSVDPGQCGRSNVTFLVTATDNCSVTNLVSTPPSGSTFAMGVTTVTNIATDAGGNQAMCTFTVTVQDSLPPVISICAPLVNATVNNGTCGATNINLGAPEATDNCGGVVTFSNNAPAVFPLGTNLVTWTARDAGGNPATCVQTVVVTDAQPPVITTCPPLVTVAANNGTCAATNVNLGNPPVATDNCGGLVTFTNNAPAAFAVGTNLVTWTALDASGNTATCVQTVVVTDTQPPVITTCPALVNVNVNNGACGATNVSLGNPPVATDNCGGTVTFTNDAPATFVVGTNLVTWTARDASGNTATCVQTVVVTDTQPPVITTCPALVNVTVNSGTCSATNVNLGNPPVATDNCGGTVTFTNNAPAIFAVGTNLVTWTARDAAGNTATCVQTVVVTDTQPPVITTCPALMNVTVNNGACSATNVNLGNPPVATDNCGGTVTFTNDAPAAFAVGTNLVTWTASDSSGNTATCVQAVVVTDTQPPVITTCPALVNVNVNNSACGATNINLGNPPVATDNCGGSVTFSNNAPATFALGTNLVTWTARDAGGNTATCVQTVVVTDTQPPVITTCPALIGVTVNNGACSATNVNLGNPPVATDNCGGTVTFSNDAPATFAVGTNLVTWTARDVAGNTATCVQTVVVTDTQPPVITACPVLVNVNVNNGACGATNVNLGNPPVATDNCGGIVTFSNNAPATFSVGTNLVTWTARDAGGNTATCVQAVVVSDTQPPVIVTCPAQVSVVANNGSCAATNVSLGSLTATDNCGGAVTVSNNAPASFPVGTNIVTWTARDSSGNAITCLQTVIVRDTQPPIITCPENIAITATPGQTTTNVTFSVTASDNCPGVSVVSVPASGSSFPIGTTTVTNTATDSSGNTSQCAFTVTVVRGNRAPVATDDNYTLGKNGSLTVNAPGVLGNDTDADGDALTALLLTSPAHGTLALLANGGLSYIPASNYFGSDAFTYVASDGQASSGVATVNLAITNSLSVGPQFGILAGTAAFNPQTGLFEQSVTVTNIGDSTAAALRLLVGGLRTNIYLYNASGTNGGRPFVQFNSPLDPGHTVAFSLEFYVADRRPFTNSLEAQSMLPEANGTNGGTVVSIDRAFVDSRIPGNPRFVLEFTSVPGRTYTVIYSDDNMATWKVATPSITASSTRTQWYDDGVPKTVSKPLSNNSRLYRLIIAPANP